MVWHDLFISFGCIKISEGAKNYSQISDAPEKEERNMMNVKFFLVALCLLLASSLQSFASTSYSSVDNLFSSGPFVSTETTSTIISSLSGFYDLTYIGYEAGYSNILISNGNTIFSNKDITTIATATSTGTKSSTSYDISTLLFKTYASTSTYSLSSSSSNVLIYQLKNDVSILGFLYTTGTYLIGFNDAASDSDFDDMIIAAKASAVPAPAAVWLLGSGMLGLLGYRRDQA